MSVRTYVHPVPSGADAQRAHFVGVLGHLFVRTLIRSHCSLIWLLRTARFARTHWCAHSLARLLTHSLPSSWERDLCLQIEFINRLVGLSIHPYVSPSVHHKRKNGQRCRVSDVWKKSFAPTTVRMSKALKSNFTFYQFYGHCWNLFTFCVMI